jgi:hypothetical protein
MNRNCRRKAEKIYVKVNSDFDATGYMQPRQITWGDGRTYPIEQVRDFRPANTIADMPGDCYTVMVKAFRPTVSIPVRQMVRGGGNQITQRRAEVWQRSAPIWQST